MKIGDTIKFQNKNVIIIDIAGTKDFTNGYWFAIKRTHDNKIFVTWEINLSSNGSGAYWDSEQFIEKSNGIIQYGCGRMY